MSYVLTIWTALPSGPNVLLIAIGVLLFVVFAPMIDDEPLQVDDNPVLPPKKLVKRFSKR